jgi:hypothetical protein
VHRTRTDACQWPSNIYLPTPRIPAFDECLRVQILAGTAANTLLHSLSPMFPATALTLTLFLSSVSLSLSATLPTTRGSVDPCTKIAGLPFAQPADILACFKVFPYNETLKLNVLSVVSTTLDFYTFEAQALNVPPPFQESTVNLRKEIARINATTYPVDIYLL